MVIAYHIVITCYGFWLPNDPRGSWSDFVRAFELYRHGGPPTKVDTRRSAAGVTHDVAQRRAMKQHLKRPPVILNGMQGREVARGIGEYVTDNGRQVYALCVMPDHVHAVVGRCALKAERLAEQFKARATTFMRRAGVHPCGDAVHGRLPTPWAAHAWKVFLNKPQDIRRAVAYVQNNPIKAGYKVQQYDCVVAYT